MLNVNDALTCQTYKRYRW